MTARATEGAEILIGGTRPSDPRLAKGAFYLPTIVAGITNKSTIAQQEIFGPVLCAMPFDNEDDLMQQANDTTYGLASGIWTADYKRAWRVARALEAGMVWINTYKQFSTAAPFGGFKDSGLGREKGLQGIRTYQQVKTHVLEHVRHIRRRLQHREIISEEEFHGATQRTTVSAREAASKGAAYIADFLIQQKVPYMFGVCGHGILGSARWIVRPAGRDQNHLCAP